MRKALLFLMLTIFIGCSEQAQPAASIQATSSEGGARGTRKLALLIGINDYKYPDRVSHLDGALNDVDDMFNVLTSSQYGFERADIHVLKQSQATRGNILNEIETHLTAKARPGDIVVVHYAGHGSRLRNPADPTGWDNTIVPYDSRDTEKKIVDIRDKELNARLRRLTAKVGEAGGVTFILDSCHSGTGLRAAGKIRSAPDDTRFGDNPPPPDTLGEKTGTRDIDGSGYGEPDGNHVLIAASRTDQISFEYRDNRAQEHGALTYFLVQQLMQPAAGKRTYRDVMNRVIQAVNSEFPSQRPQLEGKNANRVVFGDETIRTENYIVANPTPANQVELRGGLLHGFTEQSEFDIYGADAHAFAPPEKPIARVLLTEVKALTSTGRIISGRQVPAGSKAIERLHRFEARKTRVLYENLTGSAVLQRIKAALDQHSTRAFEPVMDGQPFHIRLEEKGGRIHMFGPDGVELSVAVAADAPGVVNQMRDRLLTWARWFGLRNLTNPGTAVQVEMMLIPKGANSPLQPGKIASFTPGDKKFDVRVKNLSSRKLFIYLLDLTSVGDSLLVYPDPGSAVPVDANGELLLPDWGVALPRQNPNYVRDVFKLIATTNEVELAYLQIEAAKGAGARNVPDDPLNRLLSESANGARNVTRSTADDWNTAEVVFDVCKQLSAARRCVE